MSLLLTSVAAYVLGCFNGAYYLGRLRGVRDIRLAGSGTAGATNAGRLLGWRYFVAVALLDGGKMLLALYAVGEVLPGSDWASGLALLGVVLGHVYPAQLSFRGGKGISSLVGAALFLFGWRYNALNLLGFGLLYLALRNYQRSGLLVLASMLVTVPLAREASASLYWCYFAAALVVLAAHAKAPRLVFKQADCEDEYEQIAALNYRTFSEEIPQHPKNDGHRIVDRFHGENTYFICKDGKKVVGMVAVRMKRPFSLDAKVKDMDGYLPHDAGKMCEIRLLSIEKEYRKTRVFRDLLLLPLRFGKALGVNMVLISGAERQLKLYRHMGFVPFHEMVGTPGAMYQPMYAYGKDLEEKLCAK